MTITIDGAWDIETEDWDKFVCGGIHDRDGFFVSWDEDEFAARLISRSGCYWAHNGGAFDHLWLADWCARKGIQWRGIPRGASIVAMYVGAVTLRDSRALWPDKLEIVSKLGGLPKLTLDLKCICDKGCDGYCAIRRDAPSRDRVTINAYLERDCLSLYRSLIRIAKLAEQWEIKLRPTVGSTAWATAVAWCDGLIGPVKRDVPEYYRIRSGYFGGRTQCFRPIASHGHRHDIHSAYPAALSAITLPTGEPESRAFARAFDRGDAGVFEARVTVRDCHIPPLPVRESDRLVYPTGRVTGSWTGDELRHAVTTGDARIESVTSGVYWIERAPLLKPYADRIWALREWAKKNDPNFYPWVKWCANSLTGKLAQRPEHETLYYDPEGCLPDILCDDSIDPEKNVGRVIGPLGETGVVYTLAREQVSPCAWVEHAAHLTAHTRIKLHNKLTEASDGAIYCDTDAVYSIDRLERDMGDALGQWAHEGTLDDWECLAPKLYRYRDQNGKTIVKGKGMSGLTSAGFDALKAGEPWVIDRGVLGAMLAMRGGEAFRRKDLRRGHHIRSTMGDRLLAGDVTRSPVREMWE